MKHYIRNIFYLFIFIGFSSAFADPTVDFFRAVRADNASGVRKLIGDGFNPNVHDEHSQTGLLIAMREPSPRVIQVLIDSPTTDVNETNDKGESPLMMAALKGNQDIVKKLLTRDAAVNKTGWTPLHYAATNGHVAIMKILLENFAFIDAESPNGTTPLMMAAGYGSTDAVKLLLDEGADPMMKNQKGMTAIDFAMHANKPDAAELIGAAIRAKRPHDGKW